MADAITYADLRFVKAPLKKSVSSRPGQDPEAYEDGDGELTYENVQVPAVPGGASGPASSGLGDRAGRAPSAGVRSEQTPSSWSSVTSPAVGRVLPCSATCLQRLLLGLLLTCLLLGVGVICLGVRYLQVSQQLQHMNRVLEATNSSLRQQLLQKIAQLRQKDKDLQESRSQLAQSQEALQDKQRVHQATEEQRHTCQLDREKTKETLEKEKQQRGALQGRLSSMRDTLRRFFKCVSAGTCSGRGEIGEVACEGGIEVTQSWQGSA
ncbi:B-cell differentiation antigen CD72 [Ctenodactylus gundi]